MSIFLSYLIIPLVLLVIIINVVFRVKIIKKYKQLKKYNFNIDKDLLLNKREIERLYLEKDPVLEKDLLEFSKNLKSMVFVAAVGFVFILIIFLITYLKT